MFVLGLFVGAVVATFVVSVYTRKWSGEHLLRAYSLGYLEGNAHMDTRKKIYPAITDAAYQENVNRAAQAALEKTFVDSGKETLLQVRAARAEAVEARAARAEAAVPKSDTPRSVEDAR